MQSAPGLRCCDLGQRMVKAKTQRQPGHSVCDQVTICSNLLHMPACHINQSINIFNVLRGNWDPTDKKFSSVNSYRQDLLPTCKAFPKETTTSIWFTPYDSGIEKHHMCACVLTYALHCSSLDSMQYSKVYSNIARYSMSARFRPQSVCLCPANHSTRQDRLG